LLRIYGILVVIIGFGFANWRGAGLKNDRVPIAAAAAVAAVAVLSFLAGGCGGYGGKPPSPHSASIAVTAQSGAISHSTIVNVMVR
jgi:hypothetical protein